MISAVKEQIKKNGKFTVTEVGSLIEALRSEIRPALEAIPDIQKKLDSTFEQVGTNTEKLVVIEIAVKKVLEELKSKADRSDLELLEKKVASLTI